MTYSTQRKQDALIATARAFLNRGPMIQYDQSRLAPNHATISRRDYFAAPEESTRQHTVHLDCSGFVYACFYQAFGYRLGADLTTNMFALEDIKVFHYDVTGTETEAERRRIFAEFRETLQVGDIIVFEFGGNGHAMLYTGDNTMIHTIPQGCDSDSYRYSTQHDTCYAEGGVYEMDLSILTEAAPDGKRSLFYFFQDTCFRFCILRPLDVIDTITPNAFVRSDPERHLGDLVIQVLTSHPQGRSAAPGDAVSYQVELANIGSENVMAKIAFSAPEGTVLMSGSDSVVVVPPGAHAAASWCVRVRSVGGGMIPVPAVAVNGMRVAAPAVIAGQNLRAEEAASLTDAAIRLQQSVEDGMDTIRKIYPRALPEAFVRAGDAVRDLFEAVDTPKGMALARKPGVWAEAMLVPAYFGGMGVITPTEVCPETRKDRVRRTLPEALQPGDIFVCSDDLAGDRAYACVCLKGGALYGKFEASGSIGMMEADSVAAWMEKLLGRCCFVLLRPSLAG